MGGMRAAFALDARMHADMKTEPSGLRGDGVGHPMSLTGYDCFSSRL
jgi:hypothetical protein